MPFFFSCPKCGTQVSDGGRACPACGLAVSEAPTPPIGHAPLAPRSTGPDGPPVASGFESVARGLDWIYALTKAVLGIAIGLALLTWWWKDRTPEHTPQREAHERVVRTADALVSSARDVDTGAREAGAGDLLQSFLPDILDFTKRAKWTSEHGDEALLLRAAATVDELAAGYRQSQKDAHESATVTRQWRAMTVAAEDLGSALRERAREVRAKPGG